MHDCCKIVCDSLWRKCALGAEVELKEVEGPDMLELTIRMRRKDGEGKAR